MSVMTYIKGSIKDNNSSQGIKSLEDEPSLINAPTKSSAFSSPPTPESTAESNLLFSFLQTNQTQKTQSGQSHIGFATILESE